jgi:hypothetical protein
VICCFNDRFHAWRSNAKRNATITPTSDLTSELSDNLSFLLQGFQTLVETAFCLDLILSQPKLQPSSNMRQRSRLLFKQFGEVHRCIRLMSDKTSEKSFNAELKRIGLKFEQIFLRLEKAVSK